LLRFVSTSLVLLAANLYGPAAAVADDETVKITQEVWDTFGKYKDWIGADGSGFFAVSEDGGSAAGAGCQEKDCAAGLASQRDALKECESNSNGGRCIVFGHDQDILVPYEIAN